MSDQAAAGAKASAVPEHRVRPQASGQALKTIAIWAVLVVLFCVLYFQFRGGSVWGPIAIVGGVLGGLGVLVGVLLFIVVRRIRRFNLANQAATNALARGELAAARETFTHWAQTTRVPAISALARHNLAWTLVRQGQLEQAIAVFTDNEAHNAKAIRSNNLGALSAADLALAYALANQLADAERWLRDSEARVEPGHSPSLPGMRAFARAVIDCRSDRAAEAARALDEGWAEHEAILQGSTVRPLRVIRAFAHAAAGPRSAGIAEATIASSRPAYPSEYSFLGVAWPEMAAFLASHDLVP